MFSRILDKLGDVNPQLLREIKGKLTTKNLLISGGISLIGQFLVYLSFVTQIPTANPSQSHTIYHKLCTGITQEDYYRNYISKCILNLRNHEFNINWDLWWKEIFITLSIITIFGLIIPGVYMLINDLAQEEKRGTLNFLRLSPQSAKNILIGKILGVPILLYFVALLALPFYLYAGFAGQVHPSIIFSFIVTLILTCIFCYITALLFGLFGQGFKGFLPWIGCGLILFFLFFMTFKPVSEDPTDWLNLFSPSILLNFIPKHLAKYNEISFEYLQVEKLKFFNLPIGESFFRTRALIIINLLGGIWCLWTSLNHRFVNPNKPILTKAQSYILVASWQIVLLGFGIDENADQIQSNFEILLIANMILFLALIAVLSPQRQTLLDWERYRQEKKKGFGNMSYIKDLLFHEKSPALLTIAVNLGIMAVILAVWIFIWGDNMIHILGYAIVSILITLIYAIIAQTILFIPSPRSSQLALGAIAALILVPITLFLALEITPESHPLWWMFTAFPWVGMENATVMSLFIASVSQLSIFIGLTARFNHVLKKAGESETQFLLSQSKV